MNKNILKVLIPVIAVVVIGESLLLLTKKPVVNQNVNSGPVSLKPATYTPVTLKWDVDMKDVKVGTTKELPLLITADKDVNIDALDLYIKYDPMQATVSTLTSGKGFVVPSFKKVSTQNGLVVMNFLVSEAAGFELKKDVAVEVAKIKVNFTKEGVVDFAVTDGTLVVENASAKVLPFNSDKLVINVSL